MNDPISRGDPICHDTVSLGKKRRVQLPFQCDCEFAVFLMEDQLKSRSLKQRVTTIWRMLNIKTKACASCPSTQCPSSQWQRGLFPHKSHVFWNKSEPIKCTCQRENRSWRASSHSRQSVHRTRRGVEINRKHKTPPAELTSVVESKRFVCLKWNQLSTPADNMHDHFWFTYCANLSFGQDLELRLEEVVWTDDAPQIHRH